MRTVYIANRAFHDYTPAGQFGKLEEITIGNVDLRSTDRLMAKVQHALRDAKEDDILLLGGAPIIGALAQGYLQRMFGKVNLLYFDMGRREYVLRSDLTFEKKEIKLEGGSIHCPQCNAVVAPAPAGVTAFATEPCELCKAEAEEAEERQVL